MPQQLTHFPLPDVGEGLTEAEIVGWRVQPGERVSVNQVFVEIETAKAAVELPCAYEGTVVELLAEPGQTVEVGTPIITIDTGSTGGGAQAPEPEPVEARAPPEANSNGDEGAERSTLVGYGPRAATTRRRPRKATPLAAQQAEPQIPAQANGSAGARTDRATRAATAEPAAPPPASAGGAVPLAKPPVRKLAKDRGVDLRALTGSGAGGAISREDVERAASGREAAGGEPAAGVPGAEERERRVPVRGVRKATAQAVVDSAFTAPHVTEFLTVDVTPMMELRERLKSDPQYRDVKVTPLAFAAKALCLAVRRTPDVNATWDEEAGEIVYKDYVHLGIAAATPRGLIVPKVRDADRMSLRELAISLDSLTETAREGKTAPADLIDGTITITNVGVFGIDTGTPILNPGESVILAFGAVRDLPWVANGEIIPRKVCQLAVSFDHRVVDGQQGSQFLADVGALLSEPAMALTF